MYRSTSKVETNSTIDVKHLLVSPFVALPSFTTKTDLNSVRTSLVFPSFLRSSHYSLLLLKRNSRHGYYNIKLCVETPRVELLSGEPHHSTDEGRHTRILDHGVSSHRRQTLVRTCLSVYGIRWNHHKNIRYFGFR